MTQAERTRSLWHIWISDRYSTPEFAAETARALSQSNAPCLALRDFWQAEKWQTLQQAIGELDWERLMVIRDGSDVRSVDESTFESALPAAQFSRHDRAIHISRALSETGFISNHAQAILREFFAFAVLTPTLATWISEVMQCVTVKAGSVEFSRYRRGDFIEPHDDCVGVRRCNLVSYLDSSDQRDGGVLRVAGPGESAAIQPMFNTAVLLPLAPTNRHWVEPWSAGLGRSSVSISFVDAD